MILVTEKNIGNQKIFSKTDLLSQRIRNCYVFTFAIDSKGDVALKVKKLNNFSNLRLWCANFVELGLGD